MGRYGKTAAPGWGSERHRATRTPPDLTRRRGNHRTRERLQELGRALSGPELPDLTACCRRSCTTARGTCMWLRRRGLAEMNLSPASTPSTVASRSSLSSVFTFYRDASL